ncbi:tRNA (guanosine(37)-N1)-methyltransferase TrmD [Pseudoramibacter alactolyticus]
MSTFYFVTLFPKTIATYFSESMMGRAVANGTLRIKIVDIRSFAHNKHRRVDDYPYGGGAGMVMQAPPVIRAIEGIPNHDHYPVIYLSPGGKPFDTGEARSLAHQMAATEGLIFLCGHYEGIDQRALDRCVSVSYTIGDYVLTGGELPALVMSDAIARHLPGVLGNVESLEEESFEHDLLEYPQYTRPEMVDGVAVPEVLLSGHHAKIAAWRHEQALKKTAAQRPDLYRKYLAEHPPKTDKK